jgi:hypothetical protein
MNVLPLRAVRLVVGSMLVSLALLAVIARPADASTILGDDLTTSPATNSTDLGYLQAYNEDGSLYAGSPVAGVLVSMSVRTTGSAGSGSALIVHKTSAFSSGHSSFFNLGPSIPFTVPAVVDPLGLVTTVQTRQKIAVGDQFGYYNAAPGLAIFHYHAGAVGPDMCAFALDGVHAVGDTMTYYAGGGCHLGVPMIQGVVEPDADNDGYGDETQDACPSSASTNGPCPPAGATFVGDGLTHDPAYSSSGFTVTLAVKHDLSLYTGAPFGGVLTSVRVRTQGAAGTGTIHVLRNTTPLAAAGITFLNVGPDIPFSATADPDPSGHVTEIPTRRPFAAGDRLGLTNDTASMYAYYFDAPTDCVFLVATHAPDTTAAYSGAGCNNFVPEVQGTVEPDVDGDGYGDVSQDACPTNSTLQTACPIPPVISAPADVSLKATAAPKGKLSGKATRSFVIKNNGGVATGALTVKLGSKKGFKTLAILPGSCAPAKNKLSCKLTALAPGASVTIKVRGTVKSKRKVSVKISVGGATSDPTPADNTTKATFKFKLPK